MPPTRSLGATSGGVRGSFGADGELIRSALTYNVAVDVARNTSDPATLLDADADALLRAGVVARFRRATHRARDAARPPALGPGRAEQPPARRRHLARTPRRHARHAAARARSRRTSASRATARSASGRSPRRPRRASAASARSAHSSRSATYVGPGTPHAHRDARSPRARCSTEVAPYRALPGASVLVRSADARARTDVTGVTLGGGSFLADRRLALDARRRERDDLERRRPSASLQGARCGRAPTDCVRRRHHNALGTFTLQLDRGLRGRPPRELLAHADAARALGQRVEHGGGVRAPVRRRRASSACSTARASRPTDSSTRRRGIRALEQALGVRTGAAPSRCT